MTRMHREQNLIRSHNKGQTLIIAIMVMFILAMISAVFIAMVARNLIRSGRSSNVSSVSQIAESGIRYADMMLTSSEEGADWRPKPDNLAVDPSSPVPNPAATPPVMPTMNTGWETLRDKHPDFKWTRAYWPEELPVGSPLGTGYAGPTGGFTAFEAGQGRFLLRVSYEPNPNVALSKHIKIESIGRWGVVFNDDPTTWKPAGNPNMRREITAYKPIGITDHVRFITNKDNRAMDFALGCPGLNVTFGRGTGTAFGESGVRGAPIRVNGNLKWYGNPSYDAIKVYLRGVEDPGTHNANDGNPIPIDKIEIAGDVKIDNVDTEVQFNRITKSGTSLTASGTYYLKTSNDSAFSTQGGFYRDGSDLTDANRMARGVKRIEPPLVDQPDPTGTTTRYRLLTLDSGERVQRSTGGWFARGRYGWGRGVYINNSRDLQPESETLFGGYTLRTDWLKPGFFFGKEGSWKGPYYIPPAAVITLYPNMMDSHNQYCFTITRTDTSSSGARADWYDPWGKRRPDFGQTIAMPYPDPKNGRTFYPDVYNNTDANAQEVHVDGNGVIYAEGNIRIRGMLPPDMQLTVVSNGTIYIDGNLLKYRNPDATIADDDPWRGLDTAGTTNTKTGSKCGLALLARENICVNTTQFFSPMNSINSDNVGSDARNGQPPYHVIINNRPDSQFKCNFEFGPWESETASNAPSEWELYLRHAGQYGSSYINAWLNSNPTTADWGMLAFNSTFTLPNGYTFTFFPALPKHIWGVGDRNFTMSGASGPGVGSSFIGDVFPLTAALNANLNIMPGAQNLLQIGLDTTTYTRNNYLMGGLAVQPLDIRIEAILYAQEGSFFVLPGNWFNPNPDDTRDRASRPPGTKAMFPFFGEPLDVRILIDGTVSENIPAAISDVEEWMAKWGKIPPTYGLSDVPTSHPGEGLTFLYDDHVGWPLKGLQPGLQNAIRTDKYGRALPIAPRLPVSGSLIYFGDVM